MPQIPAGCSTDQLLTNANTSVNLTNVVNGVYVHSTIASFSCSSDRFYLDPPTFMTECGNDGQWDSSTPTCFGKYFLWLRPNFLLDRVAVRMADEFSWLSRY